MQFCKVQVRHGPYGNGLYASQPISKGQTMLTVNQFQFLLYDSLINMYGINTDGCTNKRSQMALLLVYHMAIDNEYLKTLPRRCTNPVTMTEQQVRQLQDQPFVSQMLKKRGKLLSDYQILMKNNNQITLQSFMDAYSLVESRTLYFCTPMDPTSEVGAMIPLYDMCNHSQQVNAVDIYSHFFFDDSCYVMKAHRNYEQDEQIFISYGSYNDRHFVEYYGFIPDNNPNLIQLRIDRPAMKSKKARQVRFELMLMVCPQYVDHQAADIKPEISVTVDTQADILEIQAIRILAIPEQQYDKMDKKQLFSRLQDPNIVSGDKVRDILREAARKHMKQFPTTIEQDQNMMAHNVPEGMLLALSYRIRHKKQILMLC